MTYINVNNKRLSLLIHKKGRIRKIMNRVAVWFCIFLSFLLFTSPIVNAQDDSDGDGINDEDDAYPENSEAWSDSDGDGYADQPGLNISDDCPNTAGLSYRHMNGCYDTDGDGIPDTLDDDIDGDGITNDLELASSTALKKYDIFNAEDVPPDFDWDTIPDVLDDDDDNDGWSDQIELERGCDTFDESMTPFTMYGGNTGWFYVSGAGFVSEYRSDGTEFSLSWLLSALSSELIIPIGLVPIYFGIWYYRRRTFNRFDEELKDIQNLEKLREIEFEVGEAMRGRKLQAHHGIILRNVIEIKENELDNRWFEKYESADSEE